MHSPTHSHRIYPKVFQRMVKDDSVTKQPPGSGFNAALGEQFHVFWKQARVFALFFLDRAPIFTRLEPFSCPFAKTRDGKSVKAWAIWRSQRGEPWRMLAWYLITGPVTKMLPFMSGLTERISCGILHLLAWQIERDFPKLIFSELLFRHVSPASLRFCFDHRHSPRTNQNKMATGSRVTVFKIFYWENGMVSRAKGNIKIVPWLRFSLRVRKEYWSSVFAWSFQPDFKPHSSFLNWFNFWICYGRFPKAWPSWNNIKKIVWCTKLQKLSKNIAWWI